MTLRHSQTLLIPFLTALAVSVSAQDNAYKVKRITSGPAVTVRMADVSDDWDIHLQHLEMPRPGTGSVRGDLLLRKKRVAEMFPPRSGSRGTASGAPLPALGNHFVGNPFQGIPNDNDMAISNDTMVMSVTNSRIHVYHRHTGQSLLFRSLGNLAIPLAVAGSKYDPKVVFDPVSERFIIVYLSGFTWQTSWVIIGFSQTSDPTGDWNLYKLIGNPLENETWSDYPVIGISDNSLFIGINTFTNGSTNNSGFVQSCLWQIGLSEGYAGQELETAYYHGILPQGKPIFNITPVKGRDQPHGPNMYLLSNRNTDEQNDTIFLLEVSGPVGGPSTALTVTPLTLPGGYILPVAAPQPNGEYFDTNDSRVLGAYLDDGTIRFVQSCTDPITGTAAVLLGEVAGLGSTPTASSRIISEEGMHFGYPNISPCGLTADDRAAIITFNHCNADTFAGFSAVFLSDEGEVSDRLTVKEGLSGINVMQDTLERWGDYSGSQAHYSRSGVVWAAGSFATQSGGHGTYIAELRNPLADPSAIGDGAGGRALPLISPNPVAEDRLTIDFTLEQGGMVSIRLLGMDGRLVMLLEDWLKPGRNRLSFSTAHLASGIYTVSAVSEGRAVLTKLVVKH